jgi:hypothetical protein
MLNFDRRRAWFRFASVALLLAGGFELARVGARPAMAAIQALAVVAAGGTGRSALTSGAVLYGLGTAPVGLAVSPGDNTKALCGSNPPAFGSTCGGGVVNGGGITVYSGSALTVTAGTYYFPIGGGANPSATETTVDTDAPTPATITNFYAQISVALGMGNSGVFTWRKNASSQSLTCTISGAVATSCNDTTHSFSVVAGDLLTVQLVTTGTIVVTPNLIMSVQFGTTGSNGTVNTGTAGQTVYYAANGTAVSGATVSGAVKAGNPPTQAACADLSNGALSCSVDTTNAANISSGLLGNARYYGSLCPGSTMFVATNETTASTTFVNLATSDTCTFTLAATTSVFCQYTANEFNNSASQAQFNSVFVDGSQADDGNQVIVTANANFPLTGAAVWLASALGLGSHTITVRHKVAGGTGSWRDRALQCWATLP